MDNSEFFFIDGPNTVNYLIFCSFEVGGIPYKMAETLNRHGIEAYYISVAKQASDHNSTHFHYGNKCDKWNLSYLFENISSARRIRHLLRYIKKRYDITYCLATGSRSYLLKRAKINYNYWCFGSDLDWECFRPIWPANSFSWKSLLINIYLSLVTGYQARNSLHQADSLMIVPYQKANLDKICPHKDLFFFPHTLKTSDFDSLQRNKEYQKRTICEEIKASRFFFSSVRHFWKGTNNDFTDYKGNDVILKSYAQYLRYSSDYQSKIILVEKGPAVDQSKLLARDLGIEDFIIWVQEMPRDQLERYYQGADLCFGQFGTSVLSYAVLEPLSNATPCISFCDERREVPFYVDMAPIINSKDPEEIARHMHMLISSKDAHRDLSYKSWHWVMTNCSEEKFVSSFLRIFKSK